MRHWRRWLQSYFRQAKVLFSELVHWARLKCSMWYITERLWGRHSGVLLDTGQGHLVSTKTEREAILVLIPSCALSQPPWSRYLSTDSTSESCAAESQQTAPFYHRAGAAFLYLLDTQSSENTHLLLIKGKTSLVFLEVGLLDCTLGLQLLSPVFLAIRPQGFSGCYRQGLVTGGTSLVNG